MNYSLLNEYKRLCLRSGVKPFKVEKKKDVEVAIKLHLSTVTDLADKLNELLRVKR
jgi:hypothetical protein